MLMTALGLGLGGCLSSGSSGSDSGANGDTNGGNGNDDGSDNGNSGVAVDCGAVSLARASALPLDRIEVSGLDDTGLELAAVQVEDTSSADSAVTWIEAVDDEKVLYAPIHPNGTVLGGPVTLTFEFEDTTCGPIDFHVEELPPAQQGVDDLAAVVGALEDLGEAGATYLGTTMAEVRDTDPEDMPEDWWPLAAGVHLTDPDADDSLLALYDGDDPRWEVDNAERDLLDRLFAHLGLAEYLHERVEDFQGLDSSGATTQSASSMLMSTADSCEQVTAEQLGSKLDDSQVARRDVDGIPGGILDDLQNLFALGAFLPGNGKVVGTVGGGSLFAYQKRAEATYRTLPSSIEEGEAEFGATAVFEDNPDTFQWSDFIVRAYSEEWTIDQELLETVVQVHSGRDTYKKWLNNNLDANFAQNVRSYAKGQLINQVISRVDSEQLTIPARCWEADVSDPAYSEATVSFMLGSSEHQNYFLDDDEFAQGQITLTPLGTGFHLVQEIELAPVTIDIEPGSVIAETGDELEFTVYVDAHDPEIELYSDDLSLNMSNVDVPSGGYTFSYTVPDDPDEEVITITAESNTNSGFAANREPAIARAFISTGDPELAVEPGRICLDEGESTNFEAVDAQSGEALDVSWDAEYGEISPDGTFTSPGAMNAGWEMTSVVTATLDDNPDVTAGAVVTMECSCWYDATVSGDWSQSFADRISEIQFDEDTQALEAIVFRNSIEDTAFPEATLEFVTPVPAGKTGTFEARIEGTFAPNEPFDWRENWKNAGPNDWTYSGIPELDPVPEIAPVSVTIEAHEMILSAPAGDRFLSLEVDGPVVTMDADVDTGEVFVNRSGSVSIELDTNYTGLSSDGERQYCGTAP
ncbi:hypothetical protein ACNSTU_00245 [Aquisalimonas sp. APHAB1-3]|uniref:hypothetical protein n=1 Tax=Aquisalimonas sp. APHAB1-3 TaxID=3402080 RepID=UPI003AB0D816